MSSISYLNSIMTLLLIVAIIFLQVFLSNRESKIPGLILPGISFAYSLLYLIQSTTFLKGLVAFTIANIPTLIFLLIYFTCRKKINKNKDIDKMNIQDLE